jgi:AmmeMemoRadiSam system protein A
LAETFTDHEAGAILDVAARAVHDELAGLGRHDPDLDRLPPRLREPGATFVTLERDGLLLGCVGSLESVRPLGVDVARSACMAAFDDPRMPAVTADDYEAMAIKVSVLSGLEERPGGSRTDVLGWLRAGVDGLLLALGRRGRQATFLPSVWASLPDPDDFVDHLVRKAGAEPHPCPAPSRAWRYTTTELVRTPA